MSQAQIDGLVRAGLLPLSEMSNGGPSGTSKHPYIKNPDLTVAKNNNKVVPGDSTFHEDEPQETDHTASHPGLPPPFDEVVTQAHSNHGRVQHSNGVQRTHRKFALFVAGFVLLACLTGLLFFVILNGSRVVVQNTIVTGQQGPLSIDTQASALTSSKSTMIAALSDAASIATQSNLPGAVTSATVAQSTMITSVTQVSISVSVSVFSALTVPLPIQSPAGIEASMFTRSGSSIPTSTGSTVNTATMTTTLVTSLKPARPVVSVTKYFTGPGRLDGSFF